MDAMGIGQSGLAASMARLTASAANVANADTTGSVPGSGAQAGAAQVYRPVRAQQTAQAGGGVSTRFVADDPGYRLTYDPASVQADAQGMVASPDVNVPDELVEQASAGLAFTTNLKVIGTAAELERRTVDLWG